MPVNESNDDFQNAQSHLNDLDAADDSNATEVIVDGLAARAQKALDLPEGSLDEKTDKIRCISKVIKEVKANRRKIDKNDQEELFVKVQGLLKDLRDMDAKLNSEISKETKRLSQVNQMRLKIQGRLQDVLEIEDIQDQVAGFNRLIKFIREVPDQTEGEVRAVDLSDQLREVKQHHAETCLQTLKDLFEGKGKEEKYQEGLEKFLEKFENDEDLADTVQEAREILSGVQAFLQEKEEKRRRDVKKAAQPRIRLRNILELCQRSKEGVENTWGELQEIIPLVRDAAFDDEGRVDMDVVNEMMKAFPADDFENPQMAIIIQRILQMIPKLSFDDWQNMSLEDLLRDHPSEIEDEETQIGYAPDDQAKIFRQKISKLNDTQDVGVALAEAQRICLEIEMARDRDEAFGTFFAAALLEDAQAKRDELAEEARRLRPDMTDDIERHLGTGSEFSPEDTQSISSAWLKRKAAERREGTEPPEPAERQKKSMMPKVGTVLLLAAIAALSVEKPWNWQSTNHSDAPPTPAPQNPDPTPEIPSEPTPTPTPAEISADLLARYLQEVQDASTTVELDRIVSHAQARQEEGKLNQADLTRLLELIETKRAVILATEAQQRRQEISEQINDLQAELASETELLRLRELLRERFTDQDMIASLEAIIDQKLQVIERLKIAAAQERAQTLIDGLMVELRAIQSEDQQAEEKIQEILERAQRSGQGDSLDAQAIRDLLAGFQQAAEAHLQTILQERQERTTGAQQALARANRYRDELNAVQLQEGVNFTEVIDAIKARIQADNPENEHERSTFETLRAGLLTFANERHEQLRVEAEDAAATQARLEAERAAQAAQIAEAAQRHREYLEEIRNFTTADFPTRMTEFWQQVRAYRRTNPHFASHYIEVRDALQARVHEFRRAALQGRVDAVLRTHRQTPQGLTSLQALAQLRASVSAETRSIERAMAPDLLRQIFELEISIAAALPLGRDPQTQLANIRRAVDAASLSGEVQLNLDHQIETAAVRRSREERDWWLQRERSYPGRSAGITSATRLHESALDRLFELNIERRARQIVGRLSSSERPAALQLHQRRLADFQAQLSATGQSSTDTARRYIDEELYDENRTDEERRTAEALLQSGQSERERLESLIRVERRVISLLRAGR